MLRPVASGLWWCRRLEEGGYAPLCSWRVARGTPRVTPLRASPHRDGDHFVLLPDGGYPSELARVADSFAAPAWLAKNRLRSGPRSARSRAAPPVTFEPPVIDGRLTSPLDTFGRALASGALDGAVPAQLREAVAALRQELLADTRPEFEQPADGMIERSLQALLNRASGRWLSQSGRAREYVLGWLRRLTLGYLTDRETRGQHRKHVIPRYGHQDLPGGVDASRDIYPLIFEGLAPRSSNVESSRAVLSATG
jgi:hypothetical protein